MPSKMLFVFLVFTLSCLTVFCQDDVQVEVCGYLEAAHEKLNCSREQRPPEASASRYVNCDYVHFVDKSSVCTRVGNRFLEELGNDENTIACDDIPENSTICIIGMPNLNETDIFGDFNNKTDDDDSDDDTDDENDDDVLLTTQSSTSQSPTKVATTTPVKITTSKSTTTEIPMNAVNKEGLFAHNYYRKKHNVKPLQYSAFLAKYAQEWADYLAANNVMKHRSQRNYGENIANAWGKSIDGEDATDMWYDEIKNYNFQTGAKKLFSGEIGHFTQVVWAGTKEVGMGTAKSTSGTTYVVANYNPPGNVVGYYQQNVFPRVG